MKSKKLNSVTILDISRLLPGGYASLLLREQGARVIKIEQPGVGDYYRALTPNGEGLLKSHTRVIHRGKESLGLDLKSFEGRQIFFKLLKKADVVLESFRPGVLKRLGIDYPKLKKIKPDIIVCSITGFGQKGPRASLAGHDINFLGASGLLKKNKSRHGQTVIPDFQVTDLAAGMQAALQIVTALLEKQFSKKGKWIDISMLAAGESFARFCDFESTFEVTGPSTVSGGLARYDVYETSDGGEVTLGALEPKFWQKFCEIIGHPEWFSNDMNFIGERRREELKEIFKSKTLEEWKTIGEQYDVCLFPVASSVDLKNFSGKTPRLGEQTPKIMKQLGYSSKKIRELKSEGIIS